MIVDEYGYTYTLPGPFRTLREIREEHKLRGGHYFDDNTNRFFRARYSDAVYAGAIFVDSVRGPNMPRMYRAKIIGEGKSIATLADPASGEEQEYETLREAQAAVRELLRRVGVEASAVSDASSAAWASDPREERTA
jgi:hypothetical protein